MKKKLWLSAAALLAMASGAAQASVYFVLVPDMSQLQWQMDTNGVVWLRNLSSFDGAVLGCCYNFSVDTTSPAGKSIWTAMLAKIALAQPMQIGLGNGAGAPGPVTYIGNW
jgi:hypothetical protein